MTHIGKTHQSRVIMISFTMVLDLGNLSINKGLLLFCLSINDMHLKSAMIVYHCKPTAQVVQPYHQLLSIDVNQFYKEIF